MTRTDRRRHLVVAVGLVAALVSGCSGSDDPSATSTGDGKTTTTSGRNGREGTTMAGPPKQDAVTVPTIEGPITSGAGNVVLGAGGLDLAALGYAEEEYFISGDATSYTSSEPLSEDGEWTVEPAESAAYTTRIVVRRPTDDAAFSGEVVVEWFNVSGGLDADPDWTFVHDEIIRSGHAWVGVSAQKAGIEAGGESVGSILALKNADPVRYGPLVHPGDDYSYDMFSQAGAAAWFAADTILGGLEPKLVVAMGESQSAFRLTTYVNAVAPLLDVFDGFLVHSRAAAGAPLAASSTPPIEAPSPTLSRTDLQVPVLVLSAETDLVGDRLGYAKAYQPDSEHFASWEMAGTAHVDAYGLGIGDNDDGSGAADAELLAAMSAPPSSVYFGVIECDAPINTGPQTYIARSALASLLTWARDGEAPPSMPRLEMDDSGNDFVRDDAGNAVGGIRSPQVDAPVATISGLGQSGESFCALFGTTVPFDDTELASRYPDHETFVSDWNTSLDAAVDAGSFLAADAEHLRRAAAESTIGG